VLELGWILPLDEIHYELLFSSVADFLSDANDTVPGASIAAAFL
jgi:leucyl aminopeptidase